MVHPEDGRTASAMSLREEANCRETVVSYKKQNKKTLDWQVQR
jgi:hypothetical protein